MCREDAIEQLDKLIKRMGEPEFRATKTDYALLMLIREALSE